MSRAALFALAAMPPSATRDADAKAQARVLLGNLRTLVEECEAILEQADRLSIVSTWLPDLENTEHRLERTTGLLAAAAGMVAKD